MFPAWEKKHLSWAGMRQDGPRWDGRDMEGWRGRRRRQKRWDDNGGSRVAEVVVISCGVVVGSCSDDLDLRE